MSQGVIDRLFELEKSKSSRGTENERGTGLGLVLSKELIEKAQGRIWLESEEGEGSIFHIVLPKNIS
jgi:signal transduction histidine kinase